MSTWICVCLGLLQSFETFLHVQNENWKYSLRKQNKASTWPESLLWQHTIPICMWLLKGFSAMGEAALVNCSLWCIFLYFYGSVIKFVVWQVSIHFSFLQDSSKYPSPPCSWCSQMNYSFKSFLSIVIP